MTYGKLLIGLVLLIIAFGAGWKVNDWRRDSQDKAALEKSAAALTKASADLYRLASQFEKERSDETAASQARQTELRTIYRDVAVRADCAAPAATGRVLSDAVARANARAAGQPLSPVPSPSDTTGPSGGS